MIQMLVSALAKDSGLFARQTTAQPRSAFLELYLAVLCTGVARTGSEDKAEADRRKLLAQLREELAAKDLELWHDVIFRLFLGVVRPLERGSTERGDIDANAKQELELARAVFRGELEEIEQVYRRLYDPVNDADVPLGRYAFVN